MPTMTAAQTRKATRALEHLRKAVELLDDVDDLLKGDRALLSTRQQVVRAASRTAEARNVVRDLLEP